MWPWHFNLLFEPRFRFRVRFSSYFSFFSLFLKFIRPKPYFISSIVIKWSTSWFICVHVPFMYWDGSNWDFGAIRCFLFSRRSEGLALSWIFAMFLNLIFLMIFIVSFEIGAVERGSMALLKFFPLHCLSFHKESWVLYQTSRASSKFLRKRSEWGKDFTIQTDHI